MALDKPSEALQWFLDRMPQDIEDEQIEDVDEFNQLNVDAFVAQQIASEPVSG